MKKTPKSVRYIINAFIEMRAAMPLEKIMVTELCEKADINKSTFYAYFKDIYDLSDQLEDDVIQRILNSLPSPELIADDPPAFTRDLINAYHANNSLISILFSGSRTSRLPQKCDAAIRNLYFSLRPDLSRDVRTNITLSYMIYGSYYAWFTSPFSDAEKMEVICSLSEIK